MILSDKIKRYLNYINYNSDIINVDISTLFELHLKHTKKIYFSSLDLFLGIPPKCNFDDVFDYLIENNRGGLCYIHCTLFKKALEEIGFIVKYNILAQVLSQTTTENRPFTHSIIVVEINDELWLCDVGFCMKGSLLTPIKINSDMEYKQNNEIVRLIFSNKFYTLQVKDTQDHDWLDCYRFKLVDQDINFIYDYMISSDSDKHPLKNNILIHRHLNNSRIVLYNNELTYYNNLYNDYKVKKFNINSVDDFLKILEIFLTTIIKIIIIIIDYVICLDPKDKVLIPKFDTLTFFYKINIALKYLYYI